MKFTKALKYTIIFALAGVLTTFLVLYFQQNIMNTYHKNLPLVKIGDHVKSKTSRAYLSFEEILSGKKSLSFEENILTPLNECKDILNGAYRGDETALGKFADIDGEEAKAILKEAAFDAENLAAAAKIRWEARKGNINSLDSATIAQNRIVSEQDQKFDLAFQKFHSTIDRFIVYVNENENVDSKRLALFSWVSIALVFISFAFICTFLYRLQNNNDVGETDSKLKLDQESKRVSTLSQFIEAVSAGNYDIELHASSEGDNLTTMLVNMRNKLKKNAEDDYKRNWSTTGQAQIGEILRATTSTSAELYDNIIRFLVKYTKSNQGGLFILNDDGKEDQFLELMSCYAFERKKYLQKRVAIGDGLVGQCFLEGEKIYLREVPQQYISITSGLGGSNPNSLLIIPMKINEKIYGVIELASFNIYADYEIELVEKLAESIASTISNVKVNDTTRILLERTQQQAEEMKSQEEEIRQNMEELEATQEEMRRKQTILEKELDQSQKQGEILRIQEKKLTESEETLQAIVDNLPRGIFWKDKDLRFMGCNIIFVKVAGLSTNKELIGKTDFDMAWSSQAEAYRKDDLEVMRSRKAKLDIEEVNVNSDGEESWVRTSKVPIVSATGEVVAILGMFEDITAWKRKETDVTLKLKEREVALKELAELKHMIETKKG